MSVKCPDCGNRTDPTAETCPECGHIMKYKSKIPGDFRLAELRDKVEGAVREGKSASFTRDIRCKKCDHTGKIEAQDTGDTPKDRLFVFLGKGSDGHIRFRCPKCKSVIAVDPVRWALSTEMQGEYKQSNIQNVVGCLVALALAYLFFRWIVGAWG